MFWFLPAPVRGCVIVIVWRKLLGSVLKEVWSSVILPKNTNVCLFVLSCFFASVFIRFIHPSSRRMLHMVIMEGKPNFWIFELVKRKKEVILTMEWVVTSKRSLYFVPYTVAGIFFFLTARKKGLNSAAFQEKKIMTFTALFHPPSFPAHSKI